MNKTKIIIPVILFLAITIRFLYFPNNIYFGFDQARDAYMAKDILNGDLKIVGPTTTIEGLNHGVLYWYILAPLYFLGQGSPEVVSSFLRIFNAMGIFLIFYLGKILFDKWTGLTAAFLYALSFEQSQFSIYMGNPTLGVISIILMYLGLALTIFSNKNFGLTLAVLGLGFSIQFQFALSYLILPLGLILIIFYRNFSKIPLKIWILTAAAFLFSISSFILAELKYNFRILHSLQNLANFNPNKTIETVVGTYLFVVSRMNSFNFVGDLPINGFVLIALLIALITFIKKKKFSKKIIFLSVWFFSIAVTFIVHGGVENLQRDVPLFYPNVGVSVALLIFVGFLISKIITQNKILVVIALLMIFMSNLNMISKLNPKGTISEINVQQEMLLSDEKKVLDYIYSDAKGNPFAVKAVTMPFFVNTTWSYIFEWYGKGQYGYLPIWNGKNALGFPGNLKVIEAQEKLPEKRYLIIEPIRGIHQYMIDEYLKEEGYFTKIIEEKKYGQFIVQKREKF